MNDARLRNYFPPQKFEFGNLVIISSIYFCKVFMMKQTCSNFVLIYIPSLNMLIQTNVYLIIIMGISYTTFVQGLIIFVKKFNMLNRTINIILNGCLHRHSIEQKTTAFSAFQQLALGLLIRSRLYDNIQQTMSHTLRLQCRLSINKNRRELVCVS